MCYCTFVLLEIVQRCSTTKHCLEYIEANNRISPVGTLLGRVKVLLSLCMILYLLAPPVLYNVTK